MKLSTAKDEVTVDQARLTMQLMIHVYRCKIQIAKEEGKSWRESDFYNEIDRLEAKFVFSSFLDQLAGENYPYNFPADACFSLASMTEGE